MTTMVKFQKITSLSPILNSEVINMLNIEEIRKRLNSLETKNWRAEPDDYEEAANNQEWSIIGEIKSLADIKERQGSIAHWLNYTNASFIASAPVDIESLIKEVERLQSENAELKSSLSRSDCLTFCKKLFRVPTFDED